MTISGHNLVMKKTNVSDLKARLSAYLAEVRGGATVIVYDRATPIARLEPYTEDDDLVFIEPTAAPSSLKKIKGVRPAKPVNIDKLLGEMRKDR